MAPKTVAIVGAGPAGLTSIKACLAEGLKPTVFERRAVIGESLSACDVAVELGFHSKQVYQSMRKGCYVFPRRGDGGWPFDAIHGTRWRGLMPEWLREIIVKRCLERDANYDAYGLRAERKLSHSHRIANDFILNQIVVGRVKTRPAICRFFHRGVEFVDGTTLDDLDAIIFGTGYRSKIPFIADEIVSDNPGTREIYKYVLPVRLTHPSLVIVGIISPVGAAPTCFEMQARWAARLFAGKLTLPPLTEMLREIEETREAVFQISNKRGIKVVSFPYIENLAEDIGCRPNLFRMFLSDPALAIHMMFAPLVPASFRLVGPNTWPGARDAVMNCWNNYLAGTKGRVVTKPKQTWTKHSTLFLSIVIVALVMLFCT